MSSKDPIEKLLDQERLMEPAIGGDAKAFEAGVHQKIAERRQRRRSVQVAAVVCFIVGFGALNNLEIAPKELEARPVMADARQAVQPDSAGVIEAAVFEPQTDEWADDPFEAWEDEMPADYDLVVDL